MEYIGLEACRCCLGALLPVEPPENALRASSTDVRRAMPTWLNTFIKWGKDTVWGQKDSILGDLTNFLFGKGASLHLSNDLGVTRE
jgi:hypothetical protein